MTYGKTDKEARKVIENPVTFHDLNSTIAYSLGLDHAKVIESPSKRPFRMAGPDKEDAGPDHRDFWVEPWISVPGRQFSG